MAKNFFEVREEHLTEAHDTWTVTVVKPVNKLKKGQTAKVKGRNIPEVLKKIAKVWKDPNLVAVPSTHFKVQKESLDEAVSPSDYEATSEKSKFKPFKYRAKLINPQGRVSYLSSAQYDSPGAAAKAAKFYSKHMSKPMRTLDSMMHDYEKKNAIQKDQMDEAAKYTTQQIKMAYGIANDKRYKGGNYTGAVRAIEKIAKGLSNHPDVKKVLKVTNEAKEPASPDESSMAIRQLDFMADAIDEIMEHIDDGGDFPEWMQNKLTEAHTKVKDLYASLGGDDEKEDDVKESTEQLQELDAKTQKKFSVGAKNMKAYAQKNGGVDKKDFMEIAKLLDQISRVNLLQAGQILSRLNRLVDGMDTDVRERVYAELKKVGLVEQIEEVRKYTPPTKAEIEADKKKDRKADRAAGKARPSVTAKSITKRLYGR